MSKKFYKTLNASYPALVVWGISLFITVNQSLPQERYVAELQKMASINQQESMGDSTIASKNPAQISMTTQSRAYHGHAIAAPFFASIYILE